MVFASRGRAEHLHAQIYEMSLANGQERRLTYSDGESRNPTYDRRGKAILFSSTTDESKEHPDFLRETLRSYYTNARPSALPASELYLVDRDGTTNRRLTHSAGFDGYPRFDRNGFRIVMTSQRYGLVDLLVLNFDGQVLQRLTKDRAFDTDGNISPDGSSIVWVRWNEDRTGSQLFLANTKNKTARALTKNLGLYNSPVWTPSGQHIVFSAKFSNKNYDLYAITPSGDCLQRLTQSSDDKKEPAISPDGQTVAFVSNDSGRNQIYLMTLPPLQTCTPVPEN